MPEPETSRLARDAGYVGTIYGARVRVDNTMTPGRVLILAQMKSEG